MTGYYQHIDLSFQTRIINSIVVEKLLNKRIIEISAFDTITINIKAYDILEEYLNVNKDKDGFKKLLELLKNKPFVNIILKCI